MHKMLKNIHKLDHKSDGDVENVDAVGAEGGNGEVKNSICQTLKSGFFEIPFLIFPIFSHFFLFRFSHFNNRLNQAVVNPKNLVKTN